MELGGFWDSRCQSWVFPNTRKCREVLKQELGMELKIHENEQKEYIGQDGLVYKTEPNFHQVLWLKWYLNLKKCFFLGGVGSGKSKPAIDCIVNDSEVKKTLIIAPACTLTNFKVQIEKHSYLDAIIVRGSLKKKKRIIASPYYDIHLISFASLNSVYKELQASNYDLLIFDESHYMKKRHSQRSKAAYLISKLSKKNIGLTGTFITNSCIDSFSQCKVVTPDLFGTVYQDFENRYIQKSEVYNEEDGYMPQIITNKNYEEFKNKIASVALKFSLDDIKDMPPKYEEPHYFSLSKMSQKVYNENKNNISKEIRFSSAMKQTHILRKICSGGIVCSGIIQNESKYDSKLEYLLNLLEDISDERVVIWCKYHSTIDWLQKSLNSQGITNMVFDGRSKDRDQYLRFNENPEIRILISQLDMGIGWEIPPIRYSIFYELDNKQDQKVQAKGRNRRLYGSENGSRIYIYLLAKGTIEENIYNTLLKKDFTAEDAISYVKGKDYAP